MNPTAILAMNLIVSATITALASLSAHYVFSGPYRRLRGRPLSRPGWLVIDSIALLLGPMLVLASQWALPASMIPQVISIPSALTLLGVNAGVGLATVLGAVQWDKHISVVSAIREQRQALAYREAVNDQAE
jgi:hypothetical protein